MGIHEHLSDDGKVFASTLVLLTSQEEITQISSRDSVTLSSRVMILEVPALTRGTC